MGHARRGERAADRGGVSQRALNTRFYDCVALWAAGAGGLSEHDGVGAAVRAEPQHHGRAPHARRHRRPRARLLHDDPAPGRQHRLHPDGSSQLFWHSRLYRFRDLRLRPFRCPPYRARIDIRGGSLRVVRLECRGLHCGRRLSERVAVRRGQPSLRRPRHLRPAVGRRYQPRGRRADQRRAAAHVAFSLSHQRADPRGSGHHRTAVGQPARRRFGLGAAQPLQGGGAATAPSIPMSASRSTGRAGSTPSTCGATTSPAPAA